LSGSESAGVKEEILLGGNHLIEIQNIFNGTNETIFQLNIRDTIHTFRAENYSAASRITRFTAMKEKRTQKCKLCSSQER
jgi:hypothetical protein